MYFRDGRRKIDYILAYQEYPDKPQEWQEKRKDKRELFQRNLEEKGLELEQEDFEVRFKRCMLLGKLDLLFRLVYMEGIITDF